MHRTHALRASLLSPMSNDPCDRTASADGSCSPQPLEAQAPPSELAVLLASWHQQVVELLQVVESYNTPFHPPEPSAACIPAPGPKAAKLLASVQGVNSTPLHMVTEVGLQAVAPTVHPPYSQH